MHRLLAPLLNTAFVLLAGSLATAKEFAAADMEEFEAAAKSVTPGDVIVLRKGEWADAALVLVAQGTAEQPITLRAAVPGQTVLTGSSKLRLGGAFLVVQGLWFRDPAPETGDVIEFRADSKQLAQDCRLTDCAVTLSPSSAASDLTEKETRWVNLYGARHRVDHCLLQGKRNAGATMVVWLGEGNAGEHVVEHNYFGPRPKLGKNGGETIRVGDSKTSLQTAKCVVQRNLFEQCDGEVECISNKSCGNIYRGNTFLAVSGTLTLRHGHRCLVENNVFLGRRAKGTGGIRIIGEDHVVRGNWLQELTGDDSRAALCFMMGLPDSPLNGYSPVRRARVEDNTVVGCRTPLLLGMAEVKKATLPPLECVLAGNRISSGAHPAVEICCELAGVRWEGNTFSGSNPGLPPDGGIRWAEPELPTAPRALTRAEAGTSWQLPEEGQPASVR